MIEIIKKEPYRSKPKVNTPTDMIRVTICCTLKDWKYLEKYINKEEQLKKLGLT